MDLFSKTNDLRFCNYSDTINQTTTLVNPNPSPPPTKKNLPPTHPLPQPLDGSTSFDPAIANAPRWAASSSPKSSAAACSAASPECYSGGGRCCRSSRSTRPPGNVTRCCECGAERVNTDEYSTHLRATSIETSMDVGKIT